jgi:hypothetical protein
MFIRHELKMQDCWWLQPGYASKSNHTAANVHNRRCQLPDIGAAAGDRGGHSDKSHLEFCPMYSVPAM